MSKAFPAWTKKEIFSNMEEKMFPVKIVIPRNMIQKTHFGRITASFFKYSKTEDLRKTRIFVKKLEKPKLILPYNFGNKFVQFPKIDPPVTKGKIILGKNRLSNKFEI